MTKKIDTLLARYFGGTASQKDMDALERWLSSDQKNQTYFDELTDLYCKVGCPEVQIPEPNTSQAKATFLAYMENEEEHQSTSVLASAEKKPFYTYWLFQAASILLLLTLSISVWYVKYSEREIRLTSGEKPIESVLPDGTQVLLSKNSQLTYQANFGNKDKTVHLSGEATFQTGSEGKGSLHVKTDQLTIEDIGTIFTITAYPDSKAVIVSVKEGEVNLYSANKQLTHLRANETCRYNKSDETILLSNPDNIQGNNISDLQPSSPKNDHHTSDQSFKKYHYQFNSKPLSFVIETISRDYGVTIELENKAMGMREITVSFNQEKVELILEVISETLNLRVSKIADGYKLSSQ